jgi:glutamate racemase
MSKPIGIFDSGLGGLTVLKVLAKNFPHESFIYLGDIARLPYGNKSPETIRKYGDQILRFLKNQDVKAMVIACNSASTVYLGEKSFEGIPLFNVIEPGSEAALKISQDKKIAVLGTSATIRSHAYAKTIAAIDPATSVAEISCPLFVPLVEEGVVNNEITDLVIKKYLEGIKKEGISTVILGCTHYPVLGDDIRKYLGKVNLIESGEVLTEKLQALNLTAKSGKRSIRLCITDVTDHFERLAKDLMHPEPLSPLEKIVL